MAEILKESSITPCASDLPVLEAEAWRLAFNLGAGITGAAALPTLLPRRNGDIQFPFMWVSDGIGIEQGLFQPKDPEWWPAIERRTLRSRLPLPRVEQGRCIGKPGFPPAALREVWR